MKAILVRIAEDELAQICSLARDAPDSRLSDAIAKAERLPTFRPLAARFLMHDLDRSCISQAHLELRALGFEHGQGRGGNEQSGMDDGMFRPTQMPMLRRAVADVPENLTALGGSRALQEFFGKCFERTGGQSQRTE